MKGEIVTMAEADGVVRATSGGHTWHIPIRNPGLFAWAMNFHRRQLRFERDDLLSPGDIVIDVGSCTGEYTTFAAERVAPTGTVYAFEPDPLYHRCLCKNVEHQGYTDTVTIERLAVSDQPADSITLYSIPNSMGGGSIEADYGRDFPENFAFQVRATTLDMYFADRMPSRIAMLEVTVNGHEPEVFGGAANVLARTDQVICQSVRSDACEAVLVDHGFVLSKLIDLNPLGSKTTCGKILLMQRPGADDGGTA